MNPTPPRQRVWFVGVSTAGSSIHALFPVWARELGLAADLAGRDLPLGSPPEAYRAIADEMTRTSGLLGAVVTSHKVRLLDAARDRFVSLHPLARLLGEVNSVAVRSDGLHGAATDSMAIRQTLDEMLDHEYFERTGAEALCFGLGGSARALAIALLSDFDGPGPPFSPRAGAPARLHAVGRRAESLAELTSVVDAAGIPRERIVLHLSDSAAENDRLVAALPGGSLVVNATGLGKDAPGSPVSPAVTFPARGVAWDFNSRGDLGFLVIAARQRAVRGLQVHDGWPYFLHGWTGALAPILDIAMDDATFGRLARAAASCRPSTAGWDGGQRKEADRAHSQTR